MAIGGTMDFGPPWDWGAELACKHARSASKALVGLEGASHMIATTSCADMPWTSMLDVLNTDEDARAALVPGGTQAAGVLYETTLE